MKTTEPTNAEVDERADKMFREIEKVRRAENEDTAEVVYLVRRLARLELILESLHNNG